MVRKAVRGLLQAVDSVIVRRVKREAFRHTKDEGLSAELAADAAMTPAEADLNADLAAVVCEKHQLAATYAPEAFLVISLAGYGGRVAYTLRKLEDLAKENREAKR